MLARSMAVGMVRQLQRVRSKDLIFRAAISVPVLRGVNQRTNASRQISTSATCRAYGLPKQGEGDEERYIPPYLAVVFEAMGVVYR